MKPLISLPFLLFFSLCGASVLNAQVPKTVSFNSTTKAVHSIQKLSSLYAEVKSSADLNIPILKMADSYHQQYMIRVLQSDTRLLRQSPSSDLPNLLYAKSADHKGYDYYLPVGFMKKESMESYFSKLPNALKRNGVVVKVQPYKSTCNCHGKM